MYWFKFRTPLLKFNFPGGHWCLQLSKGLSHCVCIVKVQDLNKNQGESCTGVKWGLLPK